MLAGVECGRGAGHRQDPALFSLQARGWSVRAFFAAIKYQVSAAVGGGVLALAGASLVAADPGRSQHPATDGGTHLLVGRR